MPKYNNTTVFYRRNAVVHQIDRKHWNKAVDLIDGYKRPPQHTKQNLCYRSGPSSRQHPRVNNSATVVPFFLIEIRQALLKHDWSAVHRLLECLLDTFTFYRVICCKIMMVILCSSPSSDAQIFKDFCRMALGLNENEDIDVFLKTMCSIPKEIPRGFLRCVQNKMYVKEDSGLVIADAFLQASLDHRMDPCGYE